jgi:hypothetical protein
MSKSNRISCLIGTAVSALAAMLGACSSGSGDSVTVEGDVAIAYVKRPVATLGNPTDAITFSAGGDLYMRERSSPSAPEINLTASLTNGQGDVSDPEVSYDGSKLLFSMRRATDPGWRVWEYDIARKTFRQIPCTVAPPSATPTGDDVDPAYLPDGRIVFASNRQETSQRVNGFAYLDEYERERVTALHVMNSDGSNCRQISYNQSHDRNPTVLQTGEVMYSRWDHVGGRNQFSIFFTNPDGTNLFVLYGAHSPGNSFLHPREMPDGRVISSLMPLSGTREGGALMMIDIKNYSEHNEPATSGLPANSGQQQPTLQPINFGRGVSQYGRYSTPYPLWDGTGRVLVSFSPSQPVQATNALTGAAETVEGTPVYGAYMFNPADKTLRPVVTAPAGYAVLDPVAIQPRPAPNIISDKALDATLAARGVGILNVKSVYDTDSQGRMGDAVLVAGIGEGIPKIGGVADLAKLKDPAQTTASQRPARFVRIARAVATQSGISREAIGETEFEMQQILGYAEVEPDGSFKIEVPSDTPVAITVVDKDGRAFTPHTNWIQVRPGETRTCNGCHSPRRGNAINAAPIAGNHPNTLMAAQSGESMAETRTRLNSSLLSLNPHMTYSDVWTNPAVRAPDAALTINYAGLTTSAPVNGVIDYPTHIHPLWTKDRGANTCTSCHNDADRNNTASAGLDLRDGTAGTGRFTSYEELMVGDPQLDANGQPIIDIVEDEFRVRREEPQVSAGGSRASHLIEVLFNQELRSNRALGATSHAAMLNASEKRLVAEWIDLGGQYFNSPRDGSNNLRGVTGLSETAFTATVHPILLNRCGACHQAFGASGSSATTPNPGFQGQRFVLTGQAEGDFNVTLSMVNNTADPASTLLLSRPVSNGIAPNPVHPQVGTPAAPVLSTTDADYKTICNWIKAGACP